MPPHMIRCNDEKSTSWVSEYRSRSAQIVGTAQEVVGCSWAMNRESGSACRNRAGKRMSAPASHAE